MSRARLRQERARNHYQRALARLETEVALQTPRRHLDTLIELAECYLDVLDDTQLKTQLVERLATLRTQVMHRHNLRLVRGGVASND